MPVTENIFDSIAFNDRFGLFEGHRPIYEKINKVLDFSKKDVSKAASVPESSVRYDNKMPQELEQRLTEWAQAISLVGEYFQDFDKTILWFRVSNPALGGISPRDMIRVGRFKKLLRFIQTALDENRR
jgi:hypothetical protein